jgi:hypothetical protein
MVAVHNNYRTGSAAMGCINKARFIGAEFGDTMATTRSATTVLPKPIFKRLCSILPPNVVLLTRSAGSQ